MQPFRSITIAGGGLAGLTVGIALRQRNVPVTVWEAGHYPRHKVCGEFLSGHGLQTLKRLGLLKLLIDAGARPAKTAAFFLADRKLATLELPEPALCISRFTLDAILAKEFCDLGGDLRCAARWPAQNQGEAVVWANGRPVCATDDGWRWYGLKAHARNVSLVADLEMHLFRDAYLGLCRLNDCEVNVCGLFRRRRGEGEGAANRIDRLCGERGSLLFHRLKPASWVEDSFCAVGGLPAGAFRALKVADRCCVGDSTAMIAPLTGNGMSMAFESAELAVGPLVEYCRGAADWPAAKSRIRCRCAAVFLKRLLVARRMNSALFAPFVGRVLVPFAFRSSILCRLLFRLTR